MISNLIIVGCTNMTKHTSDNGVEESGTELALDETYQKICHGARLILTYDAQSNTFNGTVDNTTDEILKQVRVEVILSNGKDIGLTMLVHLEPGAKQM